MPRGTFGFEVFPSDELLNTPANVEALRRLWLDRTLVRGPGHRPRELGRFRRRRVAQQLPRGRRRGRAARRGRVAALARDLPRSRRRPAISPASPGVGTPRTVKLDSTEGRALLERSQLLGWVEGNSKGHISARGVDDPRDRFNSWRRQDFDKPVEQRPRQRREGVGALVHHAQRTARQQVRKRGPRSVCRAHRGAHGRFRRRGRPRPAGLWPPCSARSDGEGRLRGGNLRRHRHHAA